MNAVDDKQPQGIQVPEPWTILETHGDSGARELAKELLAPKNMDVNNAAFSDGTPITLASRAW